MDTIPARKTQASPWFTNLYLDVFVALDEPENPKPRMFSHDTVYVAREDLPKVRAEIEREFGRIEGEWPERGAAFVKVDDQLIEAIPVSGGWVVR